MNPDNSVPGPAESDPATPKRRYQSSRRSAQAAQTRADVLAAAVACFGELGWAGSTIAAIAERAGVAPETVYGAFRSKKQLLRAAFDVAVVGDAESIPLVERPEWAALAQGSRAARVEAAMQLNTAIQARSARVWRALLEAATADPEVAQWRDELTLGRRIDVGRGIEATFDTRVDGPMFEMLMAVLGPEVYLLLTEGSGMSDAEYALVIADTTRTLVAAHRRARA